MIIKIVEDRINNKSSFKMISKKFKIPKNKISKIFKHCKDSNIEKMISELTPKERKLKGRLNVLEQVMDNQKIKQDSLKTILSKYNSKTKFKIKSIQTIHNYLKKKLKYSFRKVNFFNDKTIDPWYRRMKVMSITHFINILNEKKTILFIDETGFNKKNNELYVWAKKAEDRTLTTCAKGRNNTLISTISSDDIIYNKFYQTGTTGSLFSEYMYKMISSFKEKHPRISTKDIYIYMDNLAAHKTNAVKEQFENLGCNAIFSAPYSPEFNCIELYFSHLKRQRRKINVKNKYNYF